jgi:hypothetical protein
VIFARAARASSVKSSTVRNKLDLRAVVAVCWNCDSAEGPASASIQALASACGRRDERAPGRLPER